MTKKTTLIVLLLVAVAAILTTASILPSDSVRLRINNRYGKTLQVALRGPEGSYNLKALPGTTDFTVKAGKYTATYVTCGERTYELWDLRSQAEKRIAFCRPTDRNSNYWTSRHRSSGR